MFKGFLLISAVGVALAAMFPADVFAAPQAPATSAGRIPITSGAAHALAREPRSTRHLQTGPSCTQTKDQRAELCVETSPANTPARTPRAGGGAAPNAIPAPVWCGQHPDGGIFADSRAESCEDVTVHLTTSRTTNGVTTLTGEALMDAFSYAYTSETLGTYAHQIQTSTFSGWGDALTAEVSGSLDITFPPMDCNIRSQLFDPQPIVPMGTLRNGDGFIDTTATAPGTTGFCATSWTLRFSAPGYPDAAADPISSTGIRCDNATPGNASVGCVIPWYPAAVVYSASANPTLASHVSRAQGSGLPGATVDNPLTKDATAQPINRGRACGDAPSIAGLSCDEYPIASSDNGLIAGGTRRTFDGCNFNLPRATGPTGVSVCMIDEGDQDAQGGLNTQFFRRERVLDGDPMRVLVGP